MVNPLVSVIIPAYNGDRYIAEAVKSVLIQNYSSFEIIVVDDGSTDRTPEVLQPYQSQIRYLSQPNQGVAAARNRGIEAAVGELIALLDQDDCFRADKLTAQVAIFTANPTVAIVNSGWQLIDTDGNPISQIEPWHNLPNLTIETWLTRTPILPSALMFRREAWETVGGFNSRFDGVDDVEFIWRVALAGYKAMWLPQITVNYRQHSQTVSEQKAVERANLFITAQNHFFSQSNLPDEIRQLEAASYYEGYTWMAWHLYHTSHFSQMANYLLKSLSYTSYTVAITITDWLQRFWGYCQSYGYEFDLTSFRKLPEWQNLIQQILQKKQPRVSVIIPAYNSENYIERAVKSVLEQTYTDYEVIVIDDGSTDNTKQILSLYDDVIHYFYQLNQGAAIARNQGCKIAQGKLLAFLDADDFFLPNKLKEQIAVFDADCTIDLVQSGWIIVDKNGKGLTDVTPWKVAPELNLETWLLHKCVRPSALILRKIWWEKVGGFDHCYPPTEDLDFVLKLGLMGCKSVWLKQVHACYRQHESNLMSGGKRVIENTEKVMNLFFNRPDLPESILSLKQKEQYQRWVWLGWRMYRDGYPDLMLNCLIKSIQYASNFPTEILLHWTEAFKNISHEYGENISIPALTKTPEWQQAVNCLFSKISVRDAEEKPHILLMNTDDPGIGGLAQYDHLIMCQLANMGYKVTAVRPYHQSPLAEREKALGIQQYWLNYSTSKDLCRILRNTLDAEALYREIQPDFIIFSDGWPYSHFAAKQVAIQQNIPYMTAIGLATPEHINFSLGDNIPYAKGVLYQYGLARTFNTAAIEHLDILQQQFKLPKNKGNVIYYGRSEQYFAAPNLTIRQQLRESLDIPKDGIMCLTTARLAPIKGHQYQLDAIAQLKQTPIWSKLYFVWAGTGKGSDRDLEPELEARIKQMGVTNQVKLIGQQWNIPDWLDACDIFVLTSLAEAAPSFAVMEAMAKGLPIVASAAGGIPEGLGNTGQLLPDPNVNPEETVKVLVKTLQEWAINEKLRRKIGQNCKRRAEQLFKEERMLKETIEVIQQAITTENNDEFAQLNSIKTGVQSLNQRLHYAALVWNAWNCYCQGNEAEMVRFLQQAFCHSPFRLTSETILDWVNDFVRLSQQQGETFDSVALTQSAAWKQVLQQGLGVG
ncbi:MAG: glycosyltransferase [Microcoleaceae cyanobacterium]